jgi:hypothetical protein
MMKCTIMCLIAVGLLLSWTGASRAGFDAEASIKLKGVSYPTFLQVGDLNNDGKPDLAVSSWVREGRNKFDQSKSRVLLFYQKNGSFALPADKELIIASPWGLSIGDFDADGKSDLAVMSGRNHLYVLPGKDVFEVRHHYHCAIKGSYIVHAGRLNEKGLYDFLTAHMWWKWEGHDKFRYGNFRPPKNNKNNNITPILADLDDDGNTDVLFTTSENEIRLYYGPFMSRRVVPTDLSQFVRMKTPLLPQHIAVGDMNADGRPDLIVATRQSKPAQKQMLIYYQQSPAGFDGNQKPAITLTDVYGSPTVADLNKDGLDDLVISDGHDKVYLFVQKKGRPIASSVKDAAQALTLHNYSFTVGDINGDGYPDIASGSVRGNSISVFFNNTRGVANPQRTTPKKVVKQAAPKVVKKAGPPATKASVGPKIRNKPTYTWQECDPRENIGKVKAADDPFMIPFYTGNIQPTPQEVVYGTQYIPLARTGIILGQELKTNDARVAMLTERIRRYGGKPEFVKKVSGSYDTFISIGKTSVARELQGMKRPPSKPQGYIIHCATHRGENVVAMQGSDHQGLLWAVTSFNQLVHRRNGGIVARTAEVFDYPTVLKRGVLCGSWYSHSSVLGAWFSVRFKCNQIAFSTILGRPGTPHRRKWRIEKPESVKEDIRRVGEYLTPLGIEWYAGQRTLSYDDPRFHKEQLCCGSDEDFQTVFKMAELAAKVGGGFAIKFDDIRFPLHPDDQKRFGSAREADIYFLNRLYAALQEKYPGTKMLFCPPFYWGPTSKHNYPESRDEYLYALGKRLPKEIGIWWTGPSVKSNVISREQVKWITERLRRKPVVWQNGCGMPHMYGYSYTTDPFHVWPDWHYDGFFQDVDSYMLNGGGPMYSTGIITLSDFLWNPKAYNAEASIREAVRKIAGPDSYPDLVEVTRLLSYFDQFGLRYSPAAGKHSAESYKKLDELELAIDKAAAKYPAALSVWTGTIQSTIINIRRWCGRLAARPELAKYVKGAEISKQRAAQEANFSPKTDTFLSAYDFLGGVSARYHGSKDKRRLATYIYGAKSPYPKLATKFTVDPFPPSADYQLIISGQDDDSDKKCSIKITVNDKPIFSGPNPFVKDGWSLHTIRIPSNILSRDNRLVILSNENTSHYGRPPWFMITYAIVRKTE